MYSKRMQFHFVNVCIKYNSDHTSIAGVILNDIPKEDFARHLFSYDFGKGHKNY